MAFSTLLLYLRGHRLLFIGAPCDMPPALRLSGMRELQIADIKTFGLGYPHPEIIVTPLIGCTHDIIDIAKDLRDQDYNGELIALMAAPGAPDTTMIRREVQNLWCGQMTVFAPSQIKARAA